MPPKINLSFVAAQAGVSKSTASYALRNDPRIRPATREHVQKTAQSLGYKTAPDVSRIMRQLKTYGGRSPFEPVALLSWAHEPNANQKTHFRFDALVEQLEKELLHINLQPQKHCITSQNSLKRVLKQLNHNNTRGIILIPGPSDGPKTFDSALSKFSTVKIGTRISYPCHEIVADFEEHCLILTEQIRRNGFHSVGIIDCHKQADAKRQQLVGSFLFFEREQRIKKVSIFDAPNGVGHHNQNTLKRWIRKNEIQVAVVASQLDLIYITEMIAQMRPPYNRTKVWSLFITDTARHTGIQFDQEATCQAAAQRIHELLNFPKIHDKNVNKRILIRGNWSSPQKKS